MLYNSLYKLIDSKNYPPNLQAKLDLFLAFDRLTTKEYETLMSMLNAEV